MRDAPLTRSCFKVRGLVLLLPRTRSVCGFSTARRATLPRATASSSALRCSHSREEDPPARRCTSSIASRVEPVRLDRCNTDIGLRRTLVLVVLACSLAATEASSGQRATPSRPGAAAADVTRRLDAILTAATRNRAFNGSVLISRRGRILIRKGYGYANVARRVPNRPNTRFRISSLTNTFNLVALLQLSERGRIRLDRSVCAHIPHCPRTWRSMTPNMLLAARSGLPRIGPYPRQTRSVSACIDWLRGRPLAFDPGRGRDRSEARLLLIAYLVDRVSGTTWPGYIERNIFRPLRMTSTGVDRAAAPRP